MLARALATSVSYLYGETDDPRPAPNWHTDQGPASATEARTQEAARMLREVTALLEGQGSSLPGNQEPES